MDRNWPSWVEVRVDSIVHNVQEIKNRIGPKVQLLAVVKANGYGHGAVASSWAARQGGATFFGVGSPQEGIELREAGISDHIFILGGCFTDQADTIVAYDFIQGVHNKEVLLALDNAAQRLKKTIRVHLKVDTGMGRLGFKPEEIFELYRAWPCSKRTRVEGIFSHFATSDDVNKNYSILQIERFQQVKDRLKEKGIKIPNWHICNSGGTLNFPHAHYDMVRCGLLMYGLFPYNLMHPSMHLKPVLTWKSRIVSLKEIRKGESVSYGRNWIAGKNERIGVIPVGYHDGFDHRLTNKGEVLVRNTRVPVVGDVCMDNMMICVTNIPGVQVGDEVVLIGCMGKETISPHDMAHWTQSIAYEVLCRIGRRVPRIYIFNGKEIHTSSFLDPWVQKDEGKYDTYFSKISN